ncbi:oxidoreductase [Gottfriedia sp. S16(2024)]|uniref:oxidoreductase n=1 Tax=Gottfriedia sp. S16(2024) TaxID=3162883 RepID=UPI003D261EAB
MNKLNILEIKNLKEIINDIEVEFNHLIIDGISLYQKLMKYNFIPSLGWGVVEFQRDMIKYFLLEKPHELLWYRIPILICPDCGDLDCGFISAKIDLLDNKVIWKDFYVGDYNNDYERKLDLGPFYFDDQSYKKAIISARNSTKNRILCN